MGIYADDGSGYPGALILDGGSISTGTGNAGTVATGGTPGVYMNTGISATVLKPGLYWIGGVVQGVTTTQPTIRTGVYNTGFGGGTSSVPGAGDARSIFTWTSQTGALNTPFVAIGSAGGSSGTAPRIIFKLQ
jgi:hypothetical protein